MHHVPVANEPMIIQMDFHYQITPIDNATVIKLDGTTTEVAKSNINGGNPILTQRFRVQITADHDINEQQDSRNDGGNT
jgi:hypothetical protein